MAGDARESKFGEIMKKFWFVGLALATALAAAPAVKADTQTFSTKFGGSGVSGVDGYPGISGSGTLVGSLISGNSYEITSGSLTINGLSAVVIPDTLSVDAVETYNVAVGAFYYDDKITLGAPPYMDSTGGLLLQISSTGELIEIFAGGPGNKQAWWDEYLAGSTSGSYYQYPGWPVGANGDGAGAELDYFAINPEPSSFLLLGTGLLGLAAFLYRRRQIGQHRAA